MGKYEDFVRFRQRMNRKILNDGPLDVKRFFALDEKVYRDGILDRKTKELLGLSASLVLRCDDCVSYHIAAAREAGATAEELWETFSIALVVGGSIVIPHLRRAVALLEEIENSPG
jgi:AhpD family alkylhydroperoxidase